MFLEFLNHETKPGNPPELVKVDGTYAIRYDDVIYALDGSVLEGEGAVERVNEVSDSNTTFNEVTLLEAKREGVDETFLLAILTDSSKNTGDHYIGSYFGPRPLDVDEYFNDCRVLKLNTVGRSNGDSDIDMNERSSIFVRALFQIAPSDIEKYAVVPSDALLLHSGISTTWKSLVIFPHIVDTENGAGFEVRTYNAELYAFSTYSEEKDLITDSGSLIPNLLNQFTLEDLNSNQKVAREYAQHVAYLNTSKTVDIYAGLKLRPSTVHRCDALVEGDGTIVTSLNRTDLLDALNLTGVERELVSAAADSILGLTLIWRDRDDASVYWVVRSGSSGARRVQL